ncbi:MAG: penicillin-binding protein 2 [Actinobacteria bacterium]|nr:MAG: penicillin-binding protein 2 [Actinomycetota bacterium]
MNAPIRRVAFTIVAVFALLALSATYLQAVAGQSYREDPRNARLIAWRTGRERGAIVTADSVVVARSDPDEEDPKLFQRTYPEGPAYVHTVGLTSVLFGSTGLEEARSRDLISDRDSTISGVLNALLGGDPRPRGLRLTLDHDLQSLAVDLLGDQRGAIVALDPKTGAVLAMASTPGFDPNTLVGADAAPAGRALEEDPSEPLRDRTINSSYPPGSAFKVITTAAALESGVASPSTTFDDPVELELPGTTSTIRNFDGGVCNDGRSVSLAAAFIRSCNTTFAQLGMAVGAEQLVATAEAFGFNQPVPFDLDVLTSAIPAAAEFTDDPAAEAANAIGQRDVQATPLQMAMVAAAVANDGELMVPYAVTDVFRSDGTIESTTRPTVWRRAASPATAAVLQELMEQAVLSGTGQRAAVPGIRIAGKTGTAEVTGQAPHLWFIGFGPVAAEPGERQIALAVVIESGGDAGESGTGGSVAAPMAAELFKTFLGVG